MKRGGRRIFETPPPVIRALDLYVSAAGSEVVCG